MKKILNFWYYHKWQILGGLALVLVVGVLVSTGRKKVDADVTVYYAGDVFYDGEIDLSETEAKEYICSLLRPFLPKGEEGEALSLTLTVYDDLDVAGQYDTNQYQQLMSEMSFGKGVLFILTPELYDVLEDQNAWADLGTVREAWRGKTCLPLSELLVQDEKKTVLPTDAVVCRRRVDGGALGSTAKRKLAFSRSAALLGNLADSSQTK